MRSKSIKVDFDEDENGTIAALTCSSTIVLPSRVFTEDEASYQLFSEAMTAVVKVKRYNTV